MIKPPKPPKSIIIVRRGGKNTSPSLQLADSPEAEAWIKDVSEKVSIILNSQTLRFAAPETERWAYWHGLDALVKKLQTKKQVRTWDLNREFADASEHFNDRGFAGACTFFVHKD